MNAAWATEWLSRFSTGDLTPLMDLYTDDARFEDVTLGRKVDGKRPLRGFFTDFMNPAARENLFTFMAYSGDAHGGAVEWLWRAKHKQDFAGLPAQGKDTSVRGVSVLSFEDGKIAKCHDYWDARSLMQQLSALK